MKLTIDLDADHVTPGQHVSGRVNVLEGGPSRSLSLTVSFHERSRDYAVVPHASTGVLREGDLQTGQSVAFDFTLPEEALPAVAAAHSALYWELEVRSDEPGIDTVVRAPLHVVVASQR